MLSVVAPMVDILFHFIKGRFMTQLSHFHIFGFSHFYILLGIQLLLTHKAFCGRNLQM
jgi:hypothetical protein